MALSSCNRRSLPTKVLGRTQERYLHEPFPCSCTLRSTFGLTHIHSKPSNMFRNAKQQCTCRITAWQSIHQLPGNVGSSALLGTARHVASQDRLAVLVFGLSARMLAKAGIDDCERQGPCPKDSLADGLTICRTLASRF